MKTFKTYLNERIKTKSLIYVDMDGVLVDFFGEWAKIEKVKHYKDIKDPEKSLEKIQHIDDFWINLPMLPKAKHLLSIVKKAKGEYNILSSPLTYDPKSEPHKKEWIKKHLGFFMPKNIHITHNKPKYAKQADGTPNVLIDDYTKNINDWERAGGIGLKYKDRNFNKADLEKALGI